MKQQIDQIIERHYQSVYYYCAARLRDAEAAKDCTQEVFLALIKKQKRLTKLDEIRPWLYRAADLAILEFRRRNAKYCAVTDEELERMCETVMPEFTEDRLRELLTEEEYTLVWQHYIGGLSMRELAERADLTEDAVKQRISRIRRRLAAALTQTEKGGGTV